MIDNYFVIQDSNGTVFPFYNLDRAISFAEALEQEGFSVTLEVLV